MRWPSIVRYFLLIISLTCGTLIKVYCDCDFDVHSDEFAPLILHNNTRGYDFFISKNGRINLKNGGNIALACPGPRNALVASNANVTSATCASDGSLRVVNKNYQFSELKCRHTIRAQTRSSRKSCGNGVGQLISIGYPISKRQWMNLIEVCYDESAGRTLYTKHTIIGEEIKNASKSNFRPSFSTEAVGAGVAATVAYKQAFQKSTFNQLLGSAAAADLYINRKSYLARGHLSPDADFLYAPWQFATYFYINACPQWQAINGGNWKSLEAAVRRAVEKRKREMTVYTGTEGVLSLPGAEGNYVHIYLVSGNKLPVPKHVWKIVYDNATSDAIAFVVANNPFIEQTEGSSQEDRGDGNFCPDNICEAFGWGSSSWLNRERGYVRCCDYRTLAKAFPTLPKLRVEGILYGSNDIS